MAFGTIGKLFSKGKKPTTSETSPSSIDDSDFDNLNNSSSSQTSPSSISDSDFDSLLPLSPSEKIGAIEKSSQAIVEKVAGSRDDFEQLLAGVNPAVSQDMGGLFNNIVSEDTQKLEDATNQAIEQQKQKLELEKKDTLEYVEGLHTNFKNAEQEYNGLLSATSNKERLQILALDNNEECTLSKKYASSIKEIDGFLKSPSASPEVLGSMFEGNIPESITQLTDIKQTAIEKEQAIAAVAKFFDSTYTINQEIDEFKNKYLEEDE